MAKDKDRTLNPAAAHHKSEKARALKKSRAQLQAQRNEKLARRNPERIQRQVDELKSLEANGDIKQREKDILADLERDLKAVRKAREALGDKAPQYANRPPREGGRETILGKRSHNGDRKQYPRREQSGSDTDEEVRGIPMPEDTPPPIPREHRRYFNNRPNSSHGGAQDGANGAMLTGLSEPPKTTYSSAPQIRDLKKEAVQKFVPNVVRQKQQAASGKGGLIEPEELDRLEREGYYKPKQEVGGGEQHSNGADGDEATRLAEEEARFEREMAMVAVQDVDNDGGGGVVDRKKPSRVEIEDVDDEDA